MTKPVKPTTPKPLPKKGDTGTFTKGVERTPVRVTQDVWPAEKTVTVVPVVAPNAKPESVPLKQYKPDGEQ